jgi:hypothetical protein
MEERLDRATGLPLGLSDHYVPVAVSGPVQANRIVRVLPRAYGKGG